MLLCWIRYFRCGYTCGCIAPQHRLLTGTYIHQQRVFTASWRGCGFGASALHLNGLHLDFRPTLYVTPYIASVKHMQSKFAPCIRCTAARPFVFGSARSSGNSATLPRAGAGSPFTAQFRHCWQHASFLCRSSDRDAGELLASD